MVLEELRTIILRALGLNINKTAKISENVYIGARNLVMYNDTYINVGCFIDGNAPITLEEYVRLGPYVKILTGTHSYRNSVIRRRASDGTVCKPVVIKKGCWVGMNVVILPGVTIAEGCIIAAGAVVIKSTDPNGLYAGNPAKRVKDLSTEDDVAMISTVVNPYTM